MRAFITTVAGQSTRFNQGCADPVLKCLYHTEKTPECILFRLLRQAAEAGCDRLIVVGGYRYQDLQRMVEEYHNSSVELVYNPRWQDSGSMHSLYYGVLAAKGAAELLFCEGDVITDSESFRRLASAQEDSFAIAREPIFADRSVAAYQGPDGRLHYLFDTNHGALTFPPNVKAIFHSAQAWKISDGETFIRMNAQLTETERRGTNLVLIERYFRRHPMEQLNPITLEHWINCNTREDFARYERQKVLFDRALEFDRS
ncbi:MAG: NTP transferase domain-containing protein [Oscillospiraceae bacterium]|nr:NTP transferase domain-containing protein [Oscillospiraceae bacterium]